MCNNATLCERLPPTLSTSLGWWNGRQAATFGSHTTQFTHIRPQSHTHHYTNPEHTKHNTHKSLFVYGVDLHTGCPLLAPFVSRRHRNKPRTYIVHRSRMLGAYSKRRGAFLCVGCTEWLCYTKQYFGIENRGRVP